ncbi:MAG: hypothetical protein AAF289_20085 [Cyanobacteria bacterium P01_A01_bin.135]
MTNPRVKSDNYDPNIIPAETAARKEREEGDYKQTADKPQSDMDTTAGQTVDQEGLANNYAIEPEMYVDEPGDLKQENQQRKAERAEELKAVNQTDEAGKLTQDEDRRSKGPGVI